MKKVLSIIATALVCAVMLVSCGAKSAYQEEIEKVGPAIASGDYTEASALADKIFANKDNALASDLIFAFTTKAGEAALKLQAGDAQAAIDGYNKANEILTAAKAKSDYAKTAEAIKTLNGVDLAVVEQNVQTGIQGAQALTQQAEATEAEGEAVEGEAEGEAEATEAE